MAAIIGVARTCRLRQPLATERRPRDPGRPAAAIEAIRSTPPSPRPIEVGAALVHVSTTSPGPTESTSVGGTRSQLSSPDVVPWATNTLPR